MKEIVQVAASQDRCLEITFDDGAVELVDIKTLLDRDVFRPLQDESFFARVAIDHKFGGLIWPNGADICIDWIEAEIGRQRPRVKSA